MAGSIPWHPADIRAAIQKRGGKLAEIGRDHGITQNVLSRAMREPDYRGEQAIAAFLNMPAQAIWPNRYDSAGLPRHPRIRKKLIAEQSSLKCQKRVA